MRRRTFVAGLLASATALPLRAMDSASSEPAWNELCRRVGKRLIAVESPLVAAARSGGKGADVLFNALKNPYFLGDNPALTQTLGWIDAWTSQPSTMAVAAESAADVAAAVDFARDNRIRLVVKGGGHSYFGNSNAADSLLVWTRRMDGVELHDRFVPQGAPAGRAGQPAVSIGSGALWGRVYDAVAAKGGRYVQGGGCLTVGVAGFTQGGGFGSLSKQFGTGAANLLEAEVVTADGRVRTVNAFQDSDLFFALRGGGGGTFGIVTRLTVRTHPLPETIGAALVSVEATSDSAWRALVERTLAFYASVFLAVPGRRFWDPAFLRSVEGLVLHDSRPGASVDNIFWASNLAETGQVLHATSPPGCRRHCLLPLAGRRWLMRSSPRPLNGASRSTPTRALPAGRPKRSLPLARPRPAPKSSMRSRSSFALPKGRPPGPGLPVTSRIRSKAAAMPPA